LLGLVPQFSGLTAAMLVGLGAFAFATSVAPCLLELRGATLEHADEKWAEQAMAAAPSPAAHVVKAMSKEERGSAAGRAALQLEVDKLVEYGCLRAPVERGSIRDPTATLSALVMLATIKHVELDASLRKHKGRAVVLGNKIVKAVGRDDPAAATAVAWENMQSDLAALEDGRLVDAWALINGYGRQTVDFENGYLQCPWPAGWPVHYLVVPREIWPLLPAQLRPAPGMRDPVFPMGSCLYGHPASGHLFTNMVFDFLVARGWQPVGRAGSRALLARGDSLLCVYVDDLKASGPDGEIAQLWAELRAVDPATGKPHFRFTEPAESTLFLGQTQSRSREGEFDVLRTSMEGYCDLIVSTYEDLWKTRVRPSRVPLTRKLRSYDAQEFSGPDRRVQKMVGMLLWLSRTHRPDLAVAASALGSRVASWTPECQAELDRTIGYVASTRHAALEQRWRTAAARNVAFVLDTDADWEAPRSQSGFTFALQEADASATGSLVLLHWGSKKQPFTAESAASAEATAAHLGMRECLPLKASWPASAGAFILRVDNMQVVALARSGTSEKLEFLAKAANVRLGTLRDAVAQGWLLVVYVPTKLNRANFLTKPLGALDLDRERSLCGLRVPASALAAQNRAHLWQRQQTYTAGAAVRHAKRARVRYGALD